MQVARSKRLIVALLFLGALVYVARKDVATNPGAIERTGFAFHEVAEEAGLRFTHQAPELDPKLRNVEPHVAGVGASVAIADVDGDGLSDVYLTTSRFGAPNGLFMNRGDGTFEDVAAAAGVADVNDRTRGVSMGALFADVDNDDDEDLLVYGWGHPRLFRNDGARGAPRFTEISAGSGLERWFNSNCAVFLDYDRDGLIDLYVGGYFRAEDVLWDLKTTRIMHESFEFAENGGHNALFRNLGGGRFEDVTEAMGCDSTRWTFAAAAADFDGDGFQDLYLANDYGAEELFWNRGGTHFERASGVGLDEDSKSGMSVALGDMDNSGRLSVYVTNISKRGYLIQGNNLRENLLAEDGRFRNVAEGPVEDCGWAWGAQFADLDNDGYQDLFVVNGFISADVKNDYWYAMGKVSSATVKDVFEDAANWPPIGGLSLSGYERSRVLLNVPRRGRDGRTFRDVAEDVGVVDELDGRGVAVSDFGNRGVLDVVVANQKARTLLYRNEVAPGRHWIQFRLKGTKSNRSAIGARVVVEFGGMRQTQVIGAGTGFAAQNDRRLHFGLGATDRVDRATIDWPSGAHQVIEDPAADTLHVVVEAQP